MNKYCTCVWVKVCVYVCIYMYVYMYVYICVYILGLQRGGKFPREFGEFWKQIFQSFLAKAYNRKLKCSWEQVYARLAQLDPECSWLETLSAINIKRSVFVISFASERFSPMPGKCESAEVLRGQERHCKQIDFNYSLQHIEIWHFWSSELS